MIIDVIRFVLADYYTRCGKDNYNFYIYILQDLNFKIIKYEN